VDWTAELDNDHAQGEDGDTDLPRATRRLVDAVGVLSGTALAGDCDRVGPLGPVPCKCASVNERRLESCDASRLVVDAHRGDRPDHDAPRPLQGPPACRDLREPRDPHLRPPETATPVPMVDSGGAATVRSTAGPQLCSRAELNVALRVTVLASAATVDAHRSGGAIDDAVMSLPLRLATICPGATDPALVAAAAYVAAVHALDAGGPQECLDVLDGGSGSRHEAPGAMYLRAYCHFQLGAYARALDAARKCFGSGKLF
jgi:hypothetical protein